MNQLLPKKIKLSIVIVNCDTEKLTLECIRSIYQFEPSCFFEIILIDNGLDSIDPVHLSEFSEVRLIRTGKNQGFSKANNLGIYNSSGSFVVLLNSDTKLFDYTFDKMLAPIFFPN